MEECVYHSMVGRFGGTHRHCYLQLLLLLQVTTDPAPIRWRFLFPLSFSPPKHSHSRQRAWPGPSFVIAKAHNESTTVLYFRDRRPVNRRLQMYACFCYQYRELVYATRVDDVIKGYPIFDVRIQSPGRNISHRHG
jgi:hypothetical protein